MSRKAWSICGGQRMPVIPVQYHQRERKTEGDGLHVVRRIIPLPRFNRLSKSPHWIFRARSIDTSSHARKGREWSGVADHQ